MNKKYIIFFTYLFLLILPLVSLAQTPQRNQVTLAGIATIIFNVVVFIWQFFLGLVIIMFIFAGVKFLTAQGNPAEVATARKFVLWGLVGVAVAILGFAAVATVRSILGA